jgi:hypothetical protein
LTNKIYVDTIQMGKSHVQMGKSHVQMGKSHVQMGKKPKERIMKLQVLVYSLTIMSLSAVLLLGCGGNGPTDKTIMSTSSVTRDVDPDPKYSDWLDNGIPGQYLVVLTDATLAGGGTTASTTMPAMGGATFTASAMQQSAIAVPISVTESTTDDLVATYGGQKLASYSNVGIGFISATEAQARAMSHDSRVETVSQNRIGENSGLYNRPLASSDSGLWGLDAIDQTHPNLVGTSGFVRNNNFTYTSQGQGVDVYVIDSGINASHSEFSTSNGSRVSLGTNITGWNSDKKHGTAVASILGGKTLGVAPGVKLIDVIINYNTNKATESACCEAFDWVKANRRLGVPSVINLSSSWKKKYKIRFGRPAGSDSEGFEKALRRCTSAGISVVVAAGNSDGHVNDWSPSCVSEAIVVGAVDQSGQRAVYPNILVSTNPDIPGASNYGDKIDVFAPGKGLSVIWDGQLINDGEGTSFSSPLVAGVVAQYLQTYPNHSPATVESWIKNNATPDILKNGQNGSTNLKGSLNKFLFTNL